MITWSLSACSLGAWWRDVPVTPDAETARRWVTHELAQPEYHTQPPAIVRLINWVLDQLSQLETGTGLNTTALAVATAVVVGLVVAALYVAGPVRRARAARSSGRVWDEDDTRTAAQLRDQAQAAAEADWWALAVAEWFRAVVRGLEERTIIDERPGRTAAEAATVAADHLPDLATDLVRGAHLFDEVVYGGRDATASDEARMRALELAVRQARTAGTLAPLVEVVR
jgi:hypothetical protein